MPQPRFSAPPPLITPQQHLQLRLPRAQIEDLTCIHIVQKRCVLIQALNHPKTQKGRVQVKQWMLRTHLRTHYPLLTPPNRKPKRRQFRRLVQLKSLPKSCLYLPPLSRSISSRPTSLTPSLTLPPLGLSLTAFST